MTFHKTELDGVYLLEPKIFGDQRGYFLETFRRSHLDERGIESIFVQDNISLSQQGVVRGLHYQIGKAAQQKLVRVVRGKILDVAVDLRKDSPTFGNYTSAVLDDNTHRQLLIPKGFAHGFSVLSEEAMVCYKCSAYYNRELERGIRWDDPSIGIDWQVSDPVISEKDSNQPFLEEVSDEDLF